MWLQIAITIQIILEIIAIYILIKDGQSPVRIWTWILIILVFPILGVVLYVFFGMNLRKQKMFDLKKEIDYEQFKKFIDRFSEEIEQKILMRDDVTTRYIHLIRLLTRVNSSLLTLKNKVKILNDGPETYQAIFEACEKAEKFIHLQYYIFIDGQLADCFAEIFERKIKQGVEVRLIYDALGSWDLSNKMIGRFREIGVQLFPFMPVRFGRLARLNYRNHRKILVVDGIVGFTGGINVDDKYIKGDEVMGHWTDTHLMIQGMSVNFLHFVFLSDWLFISKENLIKPNMFNMENLVGETPVQIVSSGPDADYPNILQQYLYILYRAKEYVYIVNPYLIPDSRLSMAIKTAALSGIDVRIIVPEKSESVMIHWTVQSFFSRFLRAGVKIYLFQEGFIHSKVIISDDSVCSIGTANLDIRSFEQNFEVNALIYSKEETITMKKQILEFQKKSKFLTLEEHMARPKVNKVKEKLARLSSPLM